MMEEKRVEELEQRVQTLEEENARLGALIHKYRKTIPVLESTVLDFTQNSHLLSEDERINRYNSLTEFISKVTMEQDIAHLNCHSSSRITRQLGLHAIDAFLSLAEKQAKQNHIRFHTKIDQKAAAIASSSINEGDFLHLLTDLFENSLNAINYSANAENISTDLPYLTDEHRISIQFNTLKEKLLLEISDTGIAFKPESFQKLGLEQYTSHSDQGGSGIGFMDIWKIKKKYKISLYIHEYTLNDNEYSKKISLLFDRKDQFVLQTYRAKEIQKLLIRGDLHVFAYSDYEKPAYFDL